VRLAAAALLIGVALALLRLAQKRPSSNYAVAAGGCVALAAWAVPGVLFGLPILAAPLLDRRWPLRARVHLVGSALLGLAVVLVPWVLVHAR
jgi:4-amino-4-deoxy-L-arabinose transferase-like glycosyltransferase